MLGGDESSDEIICGDEFAHDKRRKQMLLIDTITKNCASSPHLILQKINHAIHDAGDGSKLEATVISEGYTNFSCKVSVDKHPELCLFAKFCFECAMWNQDRTVHYDLQRVENEYIIMQEMTSRIPGSAISPLACWDVKHEGQNMKLLVTSWSEADEQFCNQFIDGVVDPRIAPKLATTLAALHNIKDFDTHFNGIAMPYMENMLEHMKSVAMNACKTEYPNDRTEEYCASLGEKSIMRIYDAIIANFRQRDCLIHGDAHVFNTLVEAKPSIEELEEFGPNGTVVLCDWEMAMAGPVGRDIGLALSFPIGCMIAHGLKGQWEANQSIEAYINSLLDTYCSRMVKAGKNPTEMAYILRNVVGWCGVYMYMALYVLKVQDTFPIESAENKMRHRDAVGILGLKLMRLAYDTNFVPEFIGMVEIRELFDSIRMDEVNSARMLFASMGRKMPRRKSSTLRTSSRRLSDTEIIYLSEKRLSTSSEDEW